MATYVPLRVPPAPQDYRTSAPPPRTALVAAAGFLTVSVVALCLAIATRHHGEPQSVVATPSPQTQIYTSAEINAAKAKACSAWDNAAAEMTRASNAVAALPAGWDNPDRIRARANETRVVLAETAFLRSEIDAATPATVRNAIEQYNALSIAQQNASIQRLGTDLDRLIDDQNMLTEDIKQHCGLQ